MRLGKFMPFVTAVGLLLSLAEASSAQTSFLAQPAIAIANFGRINDSYYRGAQPQARNYAELAALGVKTVIDLTRGGRADERGLVERAGMSFYRIPLTTTSQPAPEAVARFLKLVNDPANQPVYVHCQGGRHRTGIMTAVYRLTHDGWTADRAFAEMREFEFDKGLLVSHGTLKKFVYSYYARLVTAVAAVGR